MSLWLKAWSERQQKCGHGGLPNLGFGGTVVAIIVSSFFAAHLADALFVIIVFGPHAFFAEGLRVKDWKHGVLSTGETIPFRYDILRGVLTLLFWVTCVGVCEAVAGFLTALLTGRSRWLSVLARIAGGSALLWFACWWAGAAGTFFHPIPLAALIGGLTLVWKALGNVFWRTS
jgi:hypothetical protein